MSPAACGRALLLERLARGALGGRVGGLGLLALLHSRDVGRHARHEVSVLLRGGPLLSGRLAARARVRNLVLEEACARRARRVGAGIVREVRCASAVIRIVTERLPWR